MSVSPTDRPTPESATEPRTTAAPAAGRAQDATPAAAAATGAGGGDPNKVGSVSSRSDSGLVSGLAGPLQKFLSTETGSAALLLAATLVALVWANSPWSGSYEALWATEVSFTFGNLELHGDLGHWVNDALMVPFFFVVGLEIARELKMGELRDRRAAAVPVMAALGGMVVPAAIYFAINRGGPGVHGWGIPMATDIAFAVGLLGALGRRCPVQLRVFLLTLAVADDIGAIVVIAIFYTGDLNLTALGIAVALFGAVVALRLLHGWRTPAYLVLGFGLWLAMYESGVHPTIAGVLMGVITTVYPPRQDEVDRARELTRSFRQDPTPRAAREASRSVAHAISPNERLEELLHPWVSYVVVPIFALANAGVPLNADALSRAFGSPVTWGVVIGLLAGKIIGVYGTTVLTVRSGLGVLPAELTRPRLLGGATVAGIGFTVALFVTELSFSDAALREEAATGVLLASTLAAVLGYTMLRRINPDPAARRQRPGRQRQPEPT